MTAKGYPAIESDSSFGDAELRELAILVVLGEEPTHGYQLIRSLHDLGVYVTSCSTGGVYRTCRRLSDQGFLASEWDAPESGPARRVWTVTKAGRRRIAELRPELEAYLSVGSRILDAIPVR